HWPHLLSAGVQHFEGRSVFARVYRLRSHSSKQIRHGRHDGCEGLYEEVYEACKRRPGEDDAGGDGSRRRCGLLRGVRALFSDEVVLRQRTEEGGLPRDRTGAVLLVSPHERLV